MDTSNFGKRNGKYFLKYLHSESFYKNSLLLECVQYFKLLMKGKLLDLGCGNKPYSIIYNEISEEAIGCDVPFSLHKNANIEVTCFAEDIDKHFKKNDFDCVICTEVLEHAIDDRKVIENINRVLKVNGRLLISTPFTYVLHEAPYDYKRYTIYGLRDLLEKNNFEIRSVFSMGAAFSSGFFILYYSFTKIFFYVFKKIGLKNIHENTVMRALVSIPEFVFYIFNINSFKSKLYKNSYPSKNEMFSSLGYFIVASKIKDV